MAVREGFEETLVAIDTLGKKITAEKQRLLALLLTAPIKDVVIEPHRATQTIKKITFVLTDGRKLQLHASGNQIEDNLDLLDSDLGALEKDRKTLGKKFNILPS